MVSFFGNTNVQPSDDKRRVLHATDIVRLVGEHVALKKKGREYVGLCPFHDDHTPSMGVVPHKQIYHCFACGAGGDAISFVMNFHKISFREALELLAERAGVELTPRQRPVAEQAGRADDGEAVGANRSADRGSLLRANQTASSFFQTILKHPEHGRAARDLVDRRGLTPAVVEQFEIGASPDMWDGLLRTIGNKGVDPAAFRAAGLLKPRDSGGLYDAFRNRLMFPIHDQLGRVIAFGGRRINDQEDPKYLNSPESPIFDKSSTLYALHQAAQEIRKTRRAVVCEGYMDAIACHQAGVRNAVATLGTAMTASNARILRRLCDQVVLLFDGDEAGVRAAERGVEVFFTEPVDVRIATLSGVTDAKDPDELLKRENGRALLDQAIERAIDPMDLLFSGVQRSVQGQGLSARGRIIDEFIARLCELGLARVDKVRQQLIIRKISQMAGVDWETIAGVVNSRRRLARPRGVTSEGTPWGSPASPLSPAEHLLGCVLCEPSLMHALTEEQSPLLDPDAFADGPTRRVAQTVASLVVDERPPSLQEVLSALDDPEAQRVATRLCAEVERITDGDPERLRQHWRDRLRLAALERPGMETASPPPVAEPGDGWADLASLGRSIRESRQRVGHDPRSIPRVTV
ncbi:MAG: DNA primase [Phycisphaerales bacterium]